LEASAEDRATALVESAMFALMKIGCMSEQEADGLDWLLVEKNPSARELRSLIIELEDKVLGCDKASYDQALAVIRLLKEAWREVMYYE